ncbi:autotransporter outer membrane beta-barrel domain-containing protein [Brucella intermedia]|nr:autotransporter outer membrane beta-barrel domain-containing protein [Brucella intermedia]
MNLVSLPRQNVNLRLYSLRIAAWPQLFPVLRSAARRLSIGVAPLAVALLSSASTWAADSPPVKADGTNENIAGGTSITTTTGPALWALNNGTITAADNLTLTMTGEGGVGIQAESGGTISLVDAVITTPGTTVPGVLSVGIKTDGAETSVTSTGTITIKAGIADVALGTGILATGGSSVDLATAHITALGGTAIGVDMSDYSKIHIRGGSINSSGTIGKGIGLTNYSVRDQTPISGGESRFIGENLTITTETKSVYGGGFGVEIRTYNGAVNPNIKGIVSLSNSEITTRGITSYGVMSIYVGSTANLTNTKIMTYGDDAAGLYVNSGGIISASGSTVVTAGSGAYAIYARYYSNPVPSDSSEINRVNVDSSTLTARNATAIRLGAAGDTSLKLLLDMKNGSEISGDGNLLDVTNAGSEAHITAEDSRLFGDIRTEAGTIADLKLSKGAYYQGAVLNGGDTTTITLRDAASKWLVTDSSEVKTLTNDGMVAFSNVGEYKTLSIAGDYGGNGGTLVINTVLGGDNSSTDRMEVGGDTSGSTILQVMNRDGLGAPTVNGIEVINVAGQSNGTFNLKGNYTTAEGQQAIMTSTAYAYTLQKKGNDWYLVSQYSPKPVDPVDPTDPTGPLYSAGAPVYSSYAATLQALNQLPTLQQRVGDRTLDSDTAGSNAVWGRVEGTHNRFQNGSTVGSLSQNINTYVLQAGVDGIFYEDDSGRLVGGITGQYGNAHTKVGNHFGDGGIDAQAWGLGGTLTWYGSGGLYVDAQAQANWFDSDLSIDGADPTLRDGAKAFGYALSLEAGQKFGIDGHWSLTPQTQLLWSSIDFNSFLDAYGARISSRDNGSLTARLGLAANYDNQWKGEDGRMVKTSVYGIANLYQAFGSDARIDYAGTRFDTDADKTWGGIGAGGTYAWADGKYAFSGEGSVNTSLNSFADSYAFKGSIGFKAKW